MIIFDCVFRLDYEGNVKVADFGLSEEVYTTGYFRQGQEAGVKLPYKWMPPESLQDGLFTEKSDVVGCMACMCCIRRHLFGNFS